VRIRPASEADTDTVRDLFREYAASLGIDLEFQGFERELADLPGCYGQPQGVVLLAFLDEVPAGCVALRPLAEGYCEMKRLYLRPLARGTGLGRALAEQIIAEAKKRAYTAMRLDTLDSMDSAIGLYESLGFERVPAYYENPIPGTLYFEQKLDAR